MRQRSRQSASSDRGDVVPLARRNKMVRRTIQPRQPHGASIIVLVVLIAFFAVFPLGLLGFELFRFNLMQQELRNVADAAALSGTAALASAPMGSLAAQQTNAMNVALQNFEQNSVLVTPLTVTNVVAHLNVGQSQTAPPPKNAVLNITLVDQNGNPQPTGSAAATDMKIEAIYSDSPIFLGAFLSIAPVETAYAYSTGGLPQLDLALCFDISGSMDDQTQVYLVNRYWNPTLGTVDYKIVSPSPNTIFNLCGPPNTGTSMNASQPQNLSYGAYPSPSNTNTFVFTDGSYSPAYPAANPMIGMRANPASPAGALIPEQGRPPGNYDASHPTVLNGNGRNPLLYSNAFTDMVVQTPGMPNIPSCVEASRGNLENSAVLASSQCGHPINSQVASAPVGPGQYQNYWTQVSNLVSPMSQARTAATNFFNLMNTSTNGHFMFVSFSDTAGTSPTSTFSGTNLNVDPNYTAGGTGAFPLPLVDLNQTSSQIAQVLTAINGGGAVPPLAATGKTDIADSLSAAITSLTNSAKYRPTAKRAIVLFTDGVPNEPGGSMASGDSAALAQASAAHAAGIPIYTIGLSQNASIVPLENALLGDGNHGSGNGVAYISGNGATYTLVTNITDLDAAFQSIARSLVTLQ